MTSQPCNGKSFVQTQKKVWTSQWSVILRTFYRQFFSLLYSFFSFETSATGSPGNYLYILPLGWLYATYHLSREPGNSIENCHQATTGEPDWSHTERQRFTARSPESKTRWGRTVVENVHQKGGEEQNKRHSGPKGNKNYLEIRRSTIYVFTRYYVLGRYDVFCWFFSEMGAAQLGAGKLWEVTAIFFCKMKGSSRKMRPYQL